MSKTQERTCGSFSATNSAKRLLAKGSSKSTIPPRPLCGTAFHKVSGENHCFANRRKQSDISGWHLCHAKRPLIQTRYPAGHQGARCQCWSGNKQWDSETAENNLGLGNFLKDFSWLPPHPSQPCSRRHARIHSTHGLGVALVFRWLKAKAKQVSLVGLGPFL